MSIYIYDAALQSGPITDRPSAPMWQQCVQAASELIERNPELRRSIESIYFGTMGVFPAAIGGMAPAHVPNILRSELDLTGLRGTSYHTYMSTSESGAVALIKAFNDLQSGRYQTILVVAGEAMFSTVPGMRESDRAAIRSVIRTVVDPHEAEYGLSMLPIGDLLMGALRWESGLPDALWAHIQETATLTRYAAARAYPRGMQPSKEALRERPFGVADYRDAGQNKRVSPAFRLNDVCAPANAATALVLSREPPPHARVRVAQVGEGRAKVALAPRTGPFSRASAVRRALRDVCLGGRIAPALLADPDHMQCILHDAFPSVELCFSREIDPGRSWPELVRRFYRAQDNPVGGLCAQGHALGNSGLLQIAQAFHLITRDERYVDLARAPAFDGGLVLVTSVGAALTNVVATLLHDERNEAATAALTAAEAAFEEEATRRFFAKSLVDPQWDAFLGALDRAPKESEGIVVGRTEGRPPHREPRERIGIYLVRTPAGLVLAHHALSDPLPIGAHVVLEREASFTRVDRAGTGLVVPRPECAQETVGALWSELEAWRRDRLADRLWARATITP